MPHPGLIQPELLADGQVCVDMGTPILNGPSVPTTLPPTQGGAVVAAPLEVAGTRYTVTAVSMGNPHAVVYSAGGAPVKVCVCGGGQSLGHCFFGVSHTRRVRCRVRGGGGSERGLLACVCPGCVSALTRGLWFYFPCPPPPSKPRCLTTHMR